jgi:hypothetical protein
MDGHEIYNQLEMIKKKRFQSNWGTILEISWRNWGKPSEISVTLAAVSTHSFIEHYSRWSINVTVQPTLSAMQIVVSIMGSVKLQTV